MRTNVPSDNFYSTNYEDDFTVFRSGETIMENLDSGCSAGGTADYFDMVSASVIAGETLDFTLGSRQGTTGAVYEVVGGLYADWNQDSDFDDDGESIFGAETSALAVSGSFQIPSNVAPGHYRLRAVLTNTANPIAPCYVFNGEIEDYKLSVASLSSLQWNANTVAVAPNPATDVLEIQSDAAPDKLVITDMAGKIVLEQTTSTKRAHIAKLASGMYILQAYCGGKKLQAKFVKQ